MLKKFNLKAALAAIVFTSLSLTCYAASGDLAFGPNSILFSQENILEGQTVNIYATVTNNSSEDLLGVVKFYDNGKQIGHDQTFSAFAKSTDGVFTEWTPTYGEHKITATIYPWEPELDDQSNNTFSVTIRAALDTDHDGVGNASDPDDDNDGIPDKDDLFPLDNTEFADNDLDGIGDNTDTDDDNDNVPDQYDDLPFNPNDSFDTDGDGIGNSIDPDDDNDYLSDAKEANLKTNPLEKDTDKDGYDDGKDAFPLDPSEWLDTDGDKIGDNTDTDDDNDKIADINDPFPLDKSPIIKVSGDTEHAKLLKENILDASESFDEDGTIDNYIWTLDNGSIKYGPTIKLLFNQTGKHNVNLKIIDDAGQTTSQDFQISVINSKLYLQLIITVVIITLAMAIHFKYISRANFSKDHKPIKNED